MSRQQIDLTKELTADERRYLEERGLTAQLDENAMNLMGGGVSEGDDVTVQDLKDELKRRGLPVSGNKTELEARIAENDAEEAAKAAAAE